MMVQTQMVLPRESEKPPSSSEMIVPLGIAPLRFSRNHGNYLAYQHTAAFPTVGPGVRIHLPPAESRELTGAARLRGAQGRVAGIAAMSAIGGYGPIKVAQGIVG